MQIVFDKDKQHLCSLFLQLKLFITRMYITSVQKNCGQAGRGFLSLLQTQVDFLVGVL
jgi:hypothetical protein